MQAFPDHYRTLQVHHEASQEVVEAAYKRLCRIYHPDLNHEAGAGERMKEINAAYDVLGNAIRRGGYHREWLRAAGRSAPTTAQGAGHTAQGASPKAQDPRDAARRALEEFFRCLMDGLWEEAYGRLTLSDRRRVPLDDFREWKQTVAGIYRIGSYAVKPFRKHSNCVIAGIAFREVYEFSVFVCDMDRRTGRLSEENHLKYVALDGGRWSVCLGHADLRPLILRFKYMAENAARLDPDRVYADAVMRTDGQTGLLSRMGFLERAEAEAMRSRRYGNPFTVALLIVRPAETEAGFTARQYAGMCMAHAAKRVGARIRQTDILARWGEVEFALLFTETIRENAAFALEKIAAGGKGSAELRYGLTAGLAEFDGFLLEDTLAAAASDAQIRKRTSGGVEKTFITVNDYS